MCNKLRYCLVFDLLILSKCRWQYYNNSLAFCFRLSWSHGTDSVWIKIVAQGGGKNNLDGSLQYSAEMP